MPFGIKKSQLGWILILGSFWGFSEAALGMGLRSCASFVSGSVMTGFALFFIAATWAIAQNAISVALLIVVAGLFKLFDALLLSLPVMHGAVANPIFAFLMEGMAFLFIIAVFNEKLREKTYGRAVMGGLGALVAVNLFPLVKFATGIPACIVPGTGFPLALYYAPLAVALSLITVPAGLWLGERAGSLGRNFREIASPAALILCLVLVVAMRLL
ncbi:MAG: hypothetical protein JXB23_13430 [Candidatus Aminicenantes bacterium]|nr:hypothetical protein [Candidatus Aminicenantes bacterium]